MHSLVQLRLQLSEQKKFKVDSWRKTGGIILTLISIVYLVYSVKGVLF